MLRRKECPECGSWDTERQHAERDPDVTITVRTCNDCGSEFENWFELFDKKITHTPEDDA